MCGSKPALFWLAMDAVACTPRATGAYMGDRLDGRPVLPVLVKLLPVLVAWRCSCHLIGHPPHHKPYLHMVHMGKPSEVPTCTATRVCGGKYCQLVATPLWVLLLVEWQCRLGVTMCCSCQGCKGSTGGLHSTHRHDGMQQQQT